jgi:hypothetical protein
MSVEYWWLDDWQEEFEAHGEKLAPLTFCSV